MPIQEEYVRAGRILVSPELLLDILDFSKENRVIGATLDHEGNVIEFSIAGPDMPLMPKNQLPGIVSPTYRKKDYERIVEGVSV